MCASSAESAETEKCMRKIDAGNRNANERKHMKKNFIIRMRPTSGENVKSDDRSERTKDAHTAKLPQWKWSVSQHQQIL